MGWLTQSYERSLLGKLFIRKPTKSGGDPAKMVSPFKAIVGQIRNRHVRTGSAMAVLAAAMLGSLPAGATEQLPVKATDAHTPIPQMQGDPAMMSERELERVSGQGSIDPLFDHISKFASGGNVVDVFGDVATLLNPDPILSYLEAEISFRNAIYNPTNPFVIVDRNGNALTRLPSSIGELALRTIHIRGSGNNASFGSITIRDIEIGGTTIVTSRH